MDNSRQAREKSETSKGDQQALHRSEKGTAGIIIAAETKAREAKTERLRAARLKQMAEVESSAASKTETRTTKRSAKKKAAL